MLNELERSKNLPRHTLLVPHTARRERDGLYAIRQNACASLRRLTLTADTWTAYHLS